MIVLRKRDRISFPDPIEFYDPDGMVVCDSNPPANSAIPTLKVLIHAQLSAAL